jgi:hypothetical protein
VDKKQGGDHYSIRDKRYPRNAFAFFDKLLNRELSFEQAVSQVRDKKNEVQHNLNNKDGD